MKEIIRYVKKLFGNYEPNYEYWVRLDEIQIMPQFKASYPRFEKMVRKWDFYRKTGKFESPIKLMRNFTLCDGQSSYIIAKKQGLDKVPVYFVD